MSAFNIRADFRDVEVYKTVKTLDQLAQRYGVPASQWVKLNQNENAHGTVRAADEAVARVRLHRYPDSSTDRLRHQLAEFCGVSADQIVAGNGGDEIIDVLFRLFVDPGDEVINAPPTFGFYPVAAKLNRATLVNVPRDPHFRIDAERIKGAITNRTKMILLCSPNNPSANCTEPEDLVALLETGLPVMLDEAYVEFAEGSPLGLQERYPNLMVIRTFSKWAGLAGLRVGYGIFSRELAPIVRAIRPAYTVNAAAEAAAVAALIARDELQAVIDRIKADRDGLIERLRTSTLLRVWPSSTNFVYCTPATSLPASDIYDRLLPHGILVRPFPEPDAVRITVGTPAENDRLLEALAAIEEIVSRETLEASA